MLFATALISLGVAAYAMRQRRGAGAGAMAATMLAAAVWSAGYALEIGGAGLDQKVFWAQIQYFGICAVPYCLLAFGIGYSGRRLSPVTWTALAVVPLITLTLVFTNDQHGLIWSSIALDPDSPFLVLQHGPAFWVYWIYSYILIFLGLATVANVLFHSRRLYLKQSAVIFLGLLAPWVGNGLYVLDVLPGESAFDPTPVAFTFTGILLALGLFRFRLLDMVPIARHTIVEGMQDGVLVLDARSRILDVNPAAAPLLNLPIAKAVGQSATEAVAGWAELSENLGTQREIRAGDPERVYEVSLTTPDSGESRNGRKSPHSDYESGLVVIFRDITERRRAELGLKESEERYRRLVELSPDAIVVHSAGAIEYINSAGARIMGASHPQEILGVTLRDFVHPDYLEAAIARGQSVYAGARAAPAELKFVRTDGRVIDVETASIPITYSGKPAAQLVFRDITERKAIQEELSRRARHDGLTSLPNRSAFMERLEGSLSPDGEGRVGVLFLDLDGFKVINDSLGHELGDGLLIAVARRLLSCVRPADTVARMGGDEFTVLLGKVSGAEEAEQVARRISDSLKSAFEIGGHEVFITTSIGIALALPGEHTASELLKNADAAMYEAKRDGAARHRVFEQNMVALAVKRLELGRDLRQALGRGEFVIRYQPKVSVATGEISGLEALLRWRHPELGLLLPGEFMDIAEGAGLMPEIGDVVFEETLSRMSGWLRETPDSRALTVAVNLSVRQLIHPETPGKILALLRENDLPASNLELEITEDAFVGDDSLAIAALKRLREAGISLAIDDFGTGYSSLSRLKAIPVDTIKIDESLIRELDRGGEDATIVAGLIDLTHALGKSVVAEGVENAAQLTKLEELGCDFAQGNYLCPPLPAEEIPALLSQSLHTPKRRP